jgi:hypothetical protein
MRKDMSKVIVERPRRGLSSAKVAKPGRTRVVEDDDGQPLRAGKGGRAPVNDKLQKSKWLNENLNPLKRYLGRNVGRPWNKVYAEISEHLKPSSTVQQHVRDHLEDFVAVKTRTKAGVIMTTPRYGGERALADDHRRFYVHPRTGLLRQNEFYERWSVFNRKERAADEAERAMRMRVIDAKTQLHKLKDDIWWEVTLGKIGDGREPDVVLSIGLSTLAPAKLYGREGARAIAKRQLNKADKKKHGLA